MTLLLAALVTVSGLVVDSTGVGLPGITVTLTHGTGSRTVVTDVRGRYSFAGVPDGTYDLRYELEGFVTADRHFTAAGERAEVPPQTLTVAHPEEEIILACGRRCADAPPATPYDDPLCTDSDLHDTWIEAAASGDRSAVELLRARYDQTTSLYERYRLGGALLGRLQDDIPIWTKLSADAEVCVRFPDERRESTQAYLEWCAARGVPPSEHWDRSYEALVTIAADKRSRPLLLQALETGNSDLVWVAMDGLARQHDEGSLPAIERTVRRFAEDASWLAMALAGFESAAADEVALKYLDETDRETYRSTREQP
jgi:hypothetical protein